MARRKGQAREAGAADAVRRRIVAGARRHFFAHGFRGVTMDDLAGELGMSKKTLYAHFRSKVELVEAAMLAKFAELEAEFTEILAADPDDFPGTLRRSLACVQRHTEEIGPGFLRDIRRETPDLFQIVEGRRAALIQGHFGKLFARGRKAGMVRTDVPARVLTEILLGGIQAVMNPRQLAELGVTPTVGFNAVISVVLEGVFTAKGRAKR
jgi:AcrR family transcriptional regulator